MLIKIVKRANFYAQIDKQVIADNRLSWKSKGMLTYLLGHTDDWQVRVWDLVKQATDGRAAVYSGLKELRKLGYAKLEAVRSDGRISQWQWTIFESPLLANTLLVEKRLVENRDSTKERKKHKNEKTLSQRHFVPLAQSELFIKKAAHELSEYFAKQTNSVPNPKSFQKEIPYILKSIHGDKRRFKRIAKGYMSIPDDGWKSRIPNAYMFKQKIFQIEDWVNGYAPSEPVNNVKVVFSKNENSEIPEE